MSHVVDHVDETQLHAYLDHQLEFEDPEVRKAVGRHIADCSRCSNLLKEVRLVHQKADRLLNVAKPPQRAAPSFNEIVRQAAERRKSSEYKIPVEEDSPEGARFRRMAENSEKSEEPFVLDGLDDLVENQPMSDDVEDTIGPDLVFLEAEPTTDVEADQLRDEATVESAPDEPALPAEAQDPVNAESGNHAEQGSDRGLGITLSGSFEEDMDWLSAPDEIPVEETSPSDAMTHPAEDSKPSGEELPEALAEPPHPFSDLRKLDDADSVPELDWTEPTSEVPHEPLAQDEVVFIDAGTTPDDHTTGDIDPPSKEPVPPAEEVLFIQPETTPVASAETPPPVATSPVVTRKRSRIPMFARAATILLAVGVGGWYARPLVMERFAAPESASTEQLASADAATPTDGPQTGQARTPAAVAETDPVSSNTAGRADAVTSPSPRPAREQAAAGGAELSAAPPAGSSSGSVVTGTVRDALTGRALSQAQVSISGIGQVLTDDSGRYVAANVPVGSLQVGVRQIGYESMEKSLSVRENRPVTADFDLRGSQIALDEIVTVAEPEARRARTEAVAGAFADRAGVDVSRDVAETLLGGPLVAVDGLPIAGITRTLDGADIVVVQTGPGNVRIRIVIRSPGNVGQNATLSDISITPAQNQASAVGNARYGNYGLTVTADVSGVELESLIRRITVAPESN